MKRCEQHAIDFREPGLSVEVFNER